MGGEGVDARRRYPRLPREVERGERQRPGYGDQHRQRLGVAQRVELGPGAHVAVAPGAGHQHDLGHVGRQRRLGGQRQRHVGGRPDADQCDRVRRAPQSRADRVGRDARGGRRSGRQHEPAEAIVSMHVRRGFERAEQGPVGAGMNRDGRTCHRDQGAGIGERVGKPDVAAGGGHRAHIEFRRGEGQQQRERVVGAGIAVDDDGAAAGHGRRLHLPDQMRSGHIRRGRSGVWPGRPPRAGRRGRAARRGRARCCRDARGAPRSPVAAYPPAAARTCRWRCDRSA